jgi:hypothetical protein
LKTVTQVNQDDEEKLVVADGLVKTAGMVATV